MVWRSVVIAGAVALAAQASLAQDRPPSDKRPGPPVPYLWAGQRIDTLTWGNAGRIRDKYLPAMKAYPTPEACARADGAGETPPAFTRSDLIALPSLAAKDVCLFYHVQPIDGTEAMVAELERLGFRETFRDDRRDGRGETGLYIAFAWKLENGPLLIRHGLRAWWHRLMAGKGTDLDIYIDGGMLEHLTLSGNRKFNF